MIWLNSRGGVRPAGSVVAGNVPIAGATWDVRRAQMGWNYIAYQRTSSTDSVSDFDLPAFIADAANRGAIDPSWYLMTVEAAGLVSESFSAVVWDDQPPPPATTIPPPIGSESCAVDYAVRDQWSTGFTAEVTITNFGAAADGWTLGFGSPGDQQVTNGWSATWPQSGQQVTARNADWNGTLATGGSTTIGFNGSCTGINAGPASFTHNGTTCMSS